MMSNTGISFVIQPLHLTRKLSQMIIISLLCTKGGRCQFGALKNKLGESKPKKTIVLRGDKCFTPMVHTTPSSYLQF